MDNRKIFYSISIFLVVASLLLLAIKGLDYGIDFKGGNIVHVRFDRVTNEKEIRDAFTKISTDNKLDFIKDAQSIKIQNVANGDDKEFIIQYPVTKNDSKESTQAHDLIVKELKKVIPFDINAAEISNIGPTVGDEMKKNGIIAAILSCIGILLYLGWRFDFHSASGVVIAVVHDLIITLGFIAVMRIEFDITVLAAVLTLLGSSVNDSIVIFDRIRENTRISKNGVSKKKIFDNSINQSLGRTINTTITTLCPLIALTMYGGPSIHAFAVALTFGSIIGTYSSICLAAPIVIDLFKVEKKSESISLTA